MKRYFPLALVIFLGACDGNKPDRDVPPVIDQPPVTNPTNVPPPQNLKVVVTAVYPHDTSSFTEGLQVYNGKLYEGAGDYVNSKLQFSDIKTGKVLDSYKMGGKDLFGEGINVFKGKIYQLTWQNYKAFVYDEKNIHKPIKEFKWPYEGWGMTNDGTYLIISDGKAHGNLYFVSPDSFKIVRTIAVVDNTGPVDQLNELEYIDGYIYANIWNTDFIVKIDPATGHVLQKIDCTGLLQQYAAKEISDPSFDPNSNVLNGIAYDPATKKIYITGKRWPKLFEVRFN